MDLYSIYLHIPFCERRCNYCDFNTYAGILNRLPRYIDALCQEISVVAQASPAILPVHTIYFGGGTPSLVPAGLLERVLDVVRDHFQFPDGMEITLEANPGTLAPEYLRRLRGMGVNRLSIGMQSAADEELKLLGRIHKTQDVRLAVEWARAAGFDNLSLDLIYGLPHQTLEQWRQNLLAALDLHPEHLSLYALSLEPHVPMARRIRSGRLPEPDDDLAADMYELSTDVLAEAGFQQYEISNWARADARRDLRSRHNLQYWLNLPYLGFGAGAHGSARQVRTENLARVNAYMERCLSGQTHPFPLGPALKNSVPIDRRREMQETMMMGLRLQQGVSAQTFSARFGTNLFQEFGDEIRRLQQLDLVETHLPDGSSGIRLTRRGRFLSNAVFREFVD